MRQRRRKPLVVVVVECRRVFVDFFRLVHYSRPTLTERPRLFDVHVPKRKENEKCEIWCDDRIELRQMRAPLSSSPHLSLTLTVSTTRLPSSLQTLLTIE